MSNASSTAVAKCIKLMPAASHGIWQGDNPVDFSLSLLIVQLVLVLTVTRLLAVALRPLGQPRVIAEVIGGILLGPSALGKKHEYMTKIFPGQSIGILTTFANFGLMFFLFMVGLELDMASLHRTGKAAAAISIAIAGISVPFLAGIGISIVLHKTINPDTEFIPFLVFMGVALSITAFPVLARILAERKLVTTDLGKMAIAAAAGNDVIAWIFLALAVALSGSGHNIVKSAWILLCGLAFVLAMFVVVKPLVAWLVAHSPEDQPVTELYVCIALTGVLISGFVTDLIGIHAIFGAFVFGLVFPDGHFAQALIEKIEDFVTIFMLPLYFVASGLQTNIGAIRGGRSLALLLLVIVAASGGKVIGTFVVSMAYGEKFKRALTLGFLMNTKGLVELIVLNIGKEKKVLNEETFAIMVIMALLTTFITTPVVMALHKPARNQPPYKRRRLELEVVTEQPGCNSLNLQQYNKLRVLACVHGTKCVPSVMNLVEMVRGRDTASKEAFKLLILHLIELSERPSAIMTARHAHAQASLLGSSSRASSSSSASAAAAMVHGIGVALNRVSVRTLTAIASLGDMHDDICAAAASRRAALIVLPFHKCASKGSTELETVHPGFQGVNLKVLQYAPCSVCILVDRGLGLSQQPADLDRQVAVFFFGGPDDREALTVGLRIAQRPATRLTVFRYLVPKRSEHPITVAGPACVDQELLDERCISQARSTMNLDENETMMAEEEWIQAVVGVSRKNEYSFLIVGRARQPNFQGMELYAKLSYPELGILGDAIVSVAAEASVLVVQQKID